MCVGLCVVLTLGIDTGPHRSSTVRELWSHVSGGGGQGALTLGGGGILRSSLTSALKLGESCFAEEAAGGDVWAGGGAGTSGWSGSEAADDREVSEEEGEAAVDEARDMALSGLMGFFLSLSGEVGEMAFGESVGVPLWLE